MWWVPLAAAGAAATTNIGQSFLQREWNREAANTAWEREREGAEIQHGYYMRRYQDTYSDMLKAGINPIMAASGGFNVGNAVTMPSVPMQHPTQITDISSGAKSFGELFKMEDEKNALRAESMKLQEEAQLAFEKTVKTRVEAGLVKAQERSEIQKLQNLKVELEKLGAQAWAESKRGFLAEETTRNLQTQGKLLEQQLQRLIKISDAYKGPAGDFIGYINAIFGSLNLGASIGASALIK